QLEELLGTAVPKSDEVADEIAGKIAREINSIAKKIFELYHGHFLGRESDHSWSLTLRERLRSRFLRHIKDMGRYWKGHEKTDEAVKYYIKGLEIDPISEGLYYGLMQCYIELGDFAEALSIYKRCCHTLKTLLNTTPSPKIEVLYNSFSHDKTPQQEDRSSQ
ncbi:MAG: tetratricopeptide repeat protein, partial [Deltaproteobacteria bacterium]|nr:tetratricopeptide repeat protein [Deltaproteobacteria bacterium]